METQDKQVVDAVIGRLEEYWMGDDENSGEAEFNRFAQ